MKYRPEIDGLRAVAILPVVLYHADVAGFTGGFVGVDVFFVISGYLITGLIWAEMREDRFSIVKFYERRARRILPALFAMMSVTAVISYRLLLNSDLLDFSESLIATAAFASNLLFWSEIDYFATPTDVKPLLHTWSLAVEEQFYIVFPLFLLGVRKYLRASLPVLILCGSVTSLLLSEYLVDSRPADAFYLLHARAWELLLGAVLAVASVRPFSERRLNDASAFVGLGLIAASVYFYDEDTAFPGVAAIVPCIGAFLVICATNQNATHVGRILSLRPIVGIGLISYSLYLWHWPLIVFTKYYLARPLSSAEVAIVLTLSLGLAFASWRFVENPFRGRSSPFNRNQIFRGTATAGIVLATIGLVGQGTGGFAYRPRHALLDDSPYEGSEDCLNFAGIERLDNGQLCTLGVPATRPPDFMLWGDSHANALYPMLNRVAAETGAYGVFAGEPACPPLFGLTRPTAGMVAGMPYDCSEFNDRVFDYLVEEEIENVVLVARWNLALGRPSYELESRGNDQIFVGDDQSRELSLDENFRAYRRALERTLEVLSSAKKNIWVVLQAPYTGFRVPQYLAARTHEEKLGDVRVRVDEGMMRHERIRELVTMVAADYEVTVLDSADILCIDHECLIAKDGRNLYIDDDHLSPAGAGLLSRLFAPILRQFHRP